MKGNKDSEQTSEPEVLLTIGGEIDETSITLRFFGDELEPSEITEKLECQPTNAYKNGEIIPSKFKPRVARKGTWLLQHGRNSVLNLEHQISDLFEQLPKDLEVWQDLTKRFESDIYCGAWLKGWNRDVYFSPRLLKQLSDRGLHLGMAIYCDCDIEEEE